MQKIYTLLIALFLFGCQTADVVNSSIYPTPQKVENIKGSISIKNGFRIVNSSVDSDALRVLTESLMITEKGAKLTLGVRGDKAIEKYTHLIPEKSEGYYLEVNPKGVVIAANDNTGLFYGAQSLIQLAKGERLGNTVITDYPLIKERGVVEGYYGNPFSYEDRVSQFEFYGRNKLNTYIYGPKDDPYHGFSKKWREPYPEADGKKLSQLIEVANRNKVRFVWALHPGLDLKWNKSDSVATLNKFEQMYALGVRHFAIFLDDISRKDSDTKHQINYLNYLQEEFVDKKSDVSPIILCPTVYNQAWDSGNYLTLMGEELNKEINVMWTGKIVCSMIDIPTMEYINPKIKRKAYIWLNYPVNDYAIDHLAMGPFVGTANDIASHVSGFVANPMEYGEASKVALYSIACYTWNMAQFDANQTWEKSLREIMPQNYQSFKIFCENNIDLGPSYFNLRMPNESAPFAKDRDIFLDGYKPNRYNKMASDSLVKHFESFIKASAELKTSTHNPALVKEITPWLEVFEIVAQRGITLLEMQRNLSLNDSVAFINNYQKIQSLEQKQKSIYSRDFKGSIKKANPKAANEVVGLFLAQLKKDMESYYRSTFRYKRELIPEIKIDEGSYYIKIGNKYLYNARGSKRATLRAEKDNTNPQRAEWRVEIDPLSFNYKIISEQDNRYLDNRFNLRSDSYNIAINGLTLHSKGKGYIIKNSKIAGTAAIRVDGNMLTPVKGGDKGVAATFTFEKIE